MAASKLTLQANSAKAESHQLLACARDYKIKLSHSLYLGVRAATAAAVCSIFLARTRAALLSKQMRELLKYISTRCWLVVNFIIRRQLPYIIGRNRCCMRGADPPGKNKRPLPECACCLHFN
jgi:hypothetical protein